MVRRIGATQVYTLPRGPNYERNLANRMRKKAAKQVGLSSGSWRAGAVREGFFSSCEDSTQERLRESRAKVLILENERKILEEQRKVEKLNSPMVFVDDAMRMVKKAQEYAKGSNDSKVAGWAATIASAESESIARSAPSTVVSFGSSKASSKGPVGVVVEPVKSTVASVARPAVVSKTTPMERVVPAEPVFDVPRIISDMERGQWASYVLTKMETYVVEKKYMTVKQIRAVRKEKARYLMPGDVSAFAKLTNYDSYTLVLLNKGLNVLVPKRQPAQPPPVQKGWFGF